MSDTSKVIVQYSKETSWGETPSSPSMTELLINSESLKARKDTVKSAAIRSDRQKEAIKVVGLGVEGSVTANLSATLLNAFGNGIFQSTKVEATRGAGGTAFAGTVAMTASTTQTIVFGNDADYNALKGANALRVAGSSTAANNKVHLVKSRTDATKTITLEDGSLTANDSQATTGLAISCAYWRNGVEEPESYLIQRGFTDADSNNFHWFNGLRVNTTTMTFASRSIATAEVAFIGKEPEASDTSLDDSPTAASADTPNNTSTNLGSVMDEGVALVDALSALDITINNNVAERPQLSSLFSFGHRSGDFQVTGNLTAYFNSGAMYRKFLDHDTAALRTSITQDDGKVIAIDIPNAYLLTEDSPVGGENQDVTEKVSFEAVRDATKGYTIQVDVV